MNRGDPLPWEPTSPDGADAPSGRPAVRVLPLTGDGVAVTVLTGEIDIAVEPELASVRAWLDASGLEVVVDASGVTFLDAAGWNAVSSLAPAGRAPALHDPSPPVRYLLGLIAELDGAPALAGLAEDLTAAVRSAALVDRAEGLLVADLRCTPEEARAHLVALAARGGRSLVEAAHDVTARAGSRARLSPPVAPQHRAG